MNYYWVLNGIEHLQLECEGVCVSVCMSERARFHNPNCILFNTKQTPEEEWEKDEGEASISSY